MSTENIFGSWEEMPTHGDQDNLALLWHLLAAQKNNPNMGLSQRRPEICMLWELYVRAKPKVVVEVGCAQGATAASWCILGQPDAIICLIDRDVNDARPRPGEPVHPSISSRRPLAYTVHGGGLHHLAKGNQSVVPINGWSHDPKVKEGLVAALSGRQIDFLFHDASHEESMFLADFEWMWPLMADGSVFAVHDIMPSAAEGVTKDKAWRKIVDTTQHSARFEFLGGTGSDSLGIGVLLK